MSRDLTEKEIFDIGEKVFEEMKAVIEDIALKSDKNADELLTMAKISSLVNVKILQEYQRAISDS